MACRIPGGSHRAGDGPLRTPYNKEACVAAGFMAWFPYRVTVTVSSSSPVNAPSSARARRT